MATDTEKTLADRFTESCLELNLRADETALQNQIAALKPLHDWLLGGAENAEVVIRAVQVLLADPESPDAPRRPAIRYLRHQVSPTWKSVGMNDGDIFLIQLMLLASWPHDATPGGLNFARLLDSAWVASKGRTRQAKQIQEWRQSINRPIYKSSETPHLISRPANISLPTIASPPTPETKPRVKLKTTPAANPFLAIKEASDNSITSVLQANSEHLKLLTQHINTLPSTLNEAIMRSQDSFREEARGQSHAIRSEISLLWWGQARYSSTLQKSYRRIDNPDERLWWASWESSQLAISLETEPAASFLVETLHSLGDNVNEKRPLKQWIQGLISVLHPMSTRPTISPRLQSMATEDALGMPVTWARIEASLNRPQHDLEERARRELELELDTEIDRGEWATWVFRECLLDRHLGAK